MSRLVSDFNLDIEAGCDTLQERRSEKIAAALRGAVIADVGEWIPQELFGI